MRTTIMTLALLGLGLASGAHGAGAFGPVAAQPAARSFKLGNLTLTALKDADFVVQNDGKTFGIGASSDQVSDLLRAAGVPTDRVTLSVNVLMVKTGRRIVLLDTGLGPNLHGALLASLQLTGVAPAAITDVLITHSHLDHVGGLVDAKGELAFPNATIHMASAEWLWLQKQGPAKLVAAITGHVQAFTPGSSVINGIRSRALEGHTPGHVGYEISSGNARLLDIGDLAHSSIVSLAKPQWNMGFDNDQAEARSMRTTMLAALASSNELIYTPHFPFPGVGHIVAAGAGFKWEPTL